MPIEIATTTPDKTERPTWPAVRRGWRKLCPSCGIAPLFRAYLKVQDVCPACGAELHHHRADDAPAYFTITVVGHIVIGGMLIVERTYHPPTWVQLSLWLPLCLILCLLLLPRIKGALIGLQWAMRMHGFGGVADTPVPEPKPLAATPNQRGRG